MSDASSASRRRSVASLLAGGGLTAAILGGAATPLSTEAAAAEAPTVTQPTTTTAGTATTPAEAGSQSPESGSTSTTPVAPPPTSSTQTSTAATPPPSAPATTGEGRGQTQPDSSAPTARKHAKRAPLATVQHSQQTTTTPSTTPTATKPSATPTSSTQAPPPAAAAAPLQSSTAIAPAPQLAAVESSALAAMMSGSAASLQALDFYRIPPFLLPIYQAAAVQYGVPWQVLAAINEVETDFGTDLSVSTAGAVGWMQFMPETWLQYGVDALDAGYADPYNPVDAVFAAARYLHAAGAATDLRGAILAYNHSEAYVESVLLRARLFASYPGSAIATLTGLTEGMPPVAGARVAPGSPIPQPEAPTPATGAGAVEATAPTPNAAAAGAAGTGTRTAGAASSAQSAALASPPASRGAARRAGSLDAAAPVKQLSTLQGRRNAPVVAVEDGRVVGIGVSRKLGRYLVLRDTYGDVFTYADLGSIAPDYRQAKPQPLQVPKGSLPSDEAGREQAPKQPASAGSQSPVTLHVATRQPPAAAAAAASTSEGTAEAPAGATGKVRVFAHPGNPDARVARRLLAASAHEHTLAAGWAVLARGSLVAQGTVLGHLAGGEGADAALRFAIRPAGAQSAVDPRPILANWRQLSAALHPHGAKAGEVLAGATAADSFALSSAELERAVLADPGIQMGACDRSQVAAGKVDRRALALLVFLSRSGLKPTVGELRCGSVLHTDRGTRVVFPAPGTLDIAAVNGVPIAGHQGAGTVTDVTIRTLLTIKRRYAPKRIVSLMSYPSAAITVAAGDHASFIGLQFATAARGRSVAATARASTVAGAHSSASAPAARAGQTAPKAAVSLDTLEWQHLIGEIGAIQQPKLAAAPSASAIRDARP
jgi:hypothetical protein